MGPRRKAKHKGLGKHRHLKRGIRDLKNRGKDIDQSKYFIYLVFESLYRDDNLDTDTTELKGQGAPHNLYRNVLLQILRQIFY